MLDRIDILMLMLILQSFLQIPSSIDAGLAAASLSLYISLSALPISVPCPTQRKGIEKLFNSIIFLHLFGIINFSCVLYIFFRIYKQDLNYLDFLFFFCGIFHLFHVWV